MSNTDFTNMSNDDLTSALSEAREQATALFALTEPTIEQVNEAEALVASIGQIEAEQATRAAAVKDAADRFAAARDSFNSINDGVEESDSDDADDEADDADDEAEADDAEADADDADEAEAEADDADADSAVTTASARNHTTSQKVTGIRSSAARRVGAKTKRPAVKESSRTVITAAADVPGFATGSSLDGMEQVTKALLNRVKGFAPFNAQAARQAYANSGGEPLLNKYGVASFGLDFDKSLVASAGNDYAAVQAAVRQVRDGEQALTAAGWCAPSENVYSFIADYVVDGLITVPEVSAPRGGLNITTGPVRSTQGTALDGFGFTQTEAQAEAGAVKTCETIECPDFEDHRLDAVGYCYKIPLLTQKAYPELITDALRLASVLYAHKVNRRIINDLVALSNPVSFTGYGASFTDALEALSLIAVAERRRWNIGKNAVMEVKAPLALQEVFRADMSRRNGVAMDSVSDAQIAKHFADRRLSVEYVADWQEVSIANGALVLPGEFKVMMYPSGTFIKAVEDVINLSAVHDAASLSVNEYTGVFFEQGILTAKAGYGSSLVTIPVNTAGEQGALTFDGPLVVTP